MPPAELSALVSMRRLEELLGRSRDDLNRIAEHAGRYYKPFDLRRVRGEGKWRHIDNPTDELKLLQGRILARILQPIRLLDSGGGKGKSIVDHARPHIRQNVVVTLDLRDCFPRTSHKAVYKALVEKARCSPAIAGILTRLTTFQHHLPQGAPTSPILANLTLADAQSEIAGIAGEMGLECSFYVDDIAFSGVNALAAIEPIVRLIQRHGHSVRCSKIHRMGSNEQQAITSVVTNRKLSSSRERRHAIRSQIFSLAYEPETRESDLRRVRGQIAHVAFVSPVQGAALMRLAERLLPESGVDGPRPQAGEIRPCRSSKTHGLGATNLGAKDRS